MPPGPVIRPAVAADRPAVAALIARVGFDVEVADAAPPVPDAADLLAPNDDLPGLPGRSFPSGWVIESEGRLAGSMESRIQPYVLGREPVVAAAASGLVVEPALRNLTAPLIDRYVRQPGVDLLLNTTATAAAAKIFTTFFRFRRPPGPSFAEVAFWITDGPAFARYVARRKGGWWRRLGPGLVPVAGAAALLRRPPRSWRRAAEVTAVGLDGLDPAFDRLFAAIREERPRTLLARRDRAALQWRFARLHRAGRLALLEARTAGRLAGYCALRRIDQPGLGFSRLRVIDLLARGDDPAVLQALHAAACDLARRERVAVLEVVGLPAAIRALTARGHPLQRRMASDPYLVRLLRANLAGRLDDESAWYRTSIDGDAC